MTWALIVCGLLVVGVIIFGWIFCKSISISDDDAERAWKEFVDVERNA